MPCFAAVRSFLTLAIVALPHICFPPVLRPGSEDSSNDILSVPQQRVRMIPPPSDKNPDGLCLFCGANLSQGRRKGSLVSELGFDLGRRHRSFAAGQRTIDASSVLYRGLLSRSVLLRFKK